MGREIRMVKEGWEHPKDDNGHYQPMYDEYYLDVLNEWIKNHEVWLKGKHKDQPQPYKFYAEWAGNPPDIEYYRKENWKEEECIYFQMYETVSEGTPLTPVFKTKEELINYLVETGTFWGEKYKRDQAIKFVNSKYAPSAILINNKLHTGPSIQDALSGRINDV